MTTPLEYGFEKAAYSIRQAASKLGIGRTKLYELIRNGDLRPIKPGKKNLILAIEMAALLDRWRAEPAKQHLVKRRNDALLEELGLLTNDDEIAVAKVKSKIEELAALKGQSPKEFVREGLRAHLKEQG
jgi:excisionase family DNA binding protein